MAVLIAWTRLQRPGQDDGTLSMTRLKSPSPCLERSNLEEEAQRELQVALALTRTAAAFGEYFSERFGVGGVKPDVGRCPAAAVAVPIWVVPNIVGLGAELQSCFLGNREGF